MSRIIKFRVWCKSTNTYYYNWKAVIAGHLEAKYYTALEDNKLVFQQFTGLYDKNNKEIYEGDIIKSHNKNLADEKSLLVVKYSGSSFVLYDPNCCDSCRNGFGCVCNLDEFEGLEIIGNIYENFELLDNDIHK